MYFENFVIAVLCLEVSGAGHFGFGIYDIHWGMFILCASGNLTLILQY